MGSQLLHLVSRPSLCQLQPGQQVAVHAAGRVPGPEVQDAEQSVLLRIFAIMQALLNILKCQVPQSLLQLTLLHEWQLRRKLGKLARQDKERVLNGCQDAKQITLLSVLHCGARDSSSGAHKHLLAWLQLAEAGAARRLSVLL